VPFGGFSPLENQALVRFRGGIGIDEKLFHFLL